MKVTGLELGLGWWIGLFVDLAALGFLGKRDLAALGM